MREGAFKCTITLLQCNCCNEYKQKAPGQRSMQFEDKREVELLAQKVILPRGINCWHGVGPVWTVQEVERGQRLRFFQKYWWITRSFLNRFPNNSRYRNHFANVRTVWFCSGAKSITVRKALASLIVEMPADHSSTTERGEPKPDAKTFQNPASLINLIPQLSGIQFRELI